jgi:hypothetical protein
MNVIAPSSPADWFAYGISIATLVGFVLVLISITRRLTSASDKWSLASALSEVAEVEDLDAGGHPTNVNGTPVKKTILVASASRLIAMIGTAGILSLFMGFGSLLLWHFARTGTLPDKTTDITTYLTGGLTLFAPYAVNKVSSALAPK